MEVSEHRSECKGCPTCGKWVTATFLAEVIAQLLPCERVADVCQDIFNHRASAGSVVRAVARCAEKVAPALDRIAGVLREANQPHADETGSALCRPHAMDSRRIHRDPHPLPNPKRGSQGFEVGAVLPAFRGNLITDFWGSYDTLEQCDHSRCNAHLLRELAEYFYREL